MNGRLTLNITSSASALGNVDDLVYYPSQRMLPLQGISPNMYSLAEEGTTLFDINGSGGAPDATDRTLIDAVVAPSVAYDSTTDIISWATNGQELYCEISKASIENVFSFKHHVMCTDQLSMTVTDSGYYFVRYRFREQYVSRWSNPVIISL